jgi:hypothetical protein
MSLQHCEFLTRAPCALVALDDWIVRKGRQAEIQALPQSGKFEIARMPFWAAAAIGSAADLADFAAQAGPKAMAIAPDDGAKSAWSAGATVEEARKAALDSCVKRVEQPNVDCVVIVEGDEFVPRDGAKFRRARSNGSTVPKEVRLVFVTAYECIPCEVYETVFIPRFLATETAKSVAFTRVKAGTPRVTAGTRDWPEEIAWIRDADVRWVANVQSKSPVPRFIVAVDGAIRMVKVGQWDSQVLPLIEKLVDSM